MSPAAAELDGKVALITGASKNIGAATAQLLASAGAHLVMNSRGVEALESTANQIRDKTGRTVLTVAGDIAVAADVDRLTNVALGEFGGADIVVNNAFGGGRPEPRSLLDRDEELLEEGVRANVLAPIRLAQAFVPGMIERGSGAIVNILSTAAFVPQRGRSGYGVTKAALWMLTRYMAAEFAPAVRVNAVCPGTINEDGSMKVEQWVELLPLIPLGRIGSATELARAVLFLASDASAFTTGQVVFVDGGRVNASAQ